MRPFGMLVNFELLSISSPPPLKRPVEQKSFQIGNVFVIMSLSRAAACGTRNFVLFGECCTIWSSAKCTGSVSIDLTYQQFEKRLKDIPRFGTMTNDDPYVKAYQQTCFDAPIVQCRYRETLHSRSRSGLKCWASKRSFNSASVFCLS